MIRLIWVSIEQLILVVILQLIWGVAMTRLSAHTSKVQTLLIWELVMTPLNLGMAETGVQWVYKQERTSESLN